MEMFYLLNYTIQQDKNPLNASDNIQSFIQFAEMRINTLPDSRKI